MEEVALQFLTYDEKQKEIVDRFVKIRKSRKITQKRLSVISGVSYASVRRFEESGEISFSSLIELALALRLYDDLDNLFKIEYEYKSIEKIIRDNKDWI